ncbi:MAG: J domain-containing protein [Elusimicrobia bacterium]|nr:J domain-containing protein [Elusimicrobiota bacterium]
MDQDCYEILGVPRDATPDEIKAAYRALALRRHPDLNAGDPRATEVFMRLQAAYETLGNPHLRARYDLAHVSRKRAAVPIPAVRPPPAQGAQPARVLMLIGALLSLRGFAGIFLDPQDAFVPDWLVSPDELGRGLRHYVTGTALILCGAGLRRLRGRP